MMNLEESLIFRATISFKTRPFMHHHDAKRWTCNNAFDLQWEFWVNIYIRLEERIKRERKKYFAFLPWSCFKEHISSLKRPETKFPLAQTKHVQSKSNNFWWDLQPSSKFAECTVAIVPALGVVKVLVVWPDKSGHLQARIFVPWFLCWTGNWIFEQSHLTNVMWREVSYVGSMIYVFNWCISHLLLGFVMVIRICGLLDVAVINGWICPWAELCILVMLVSSVFIAWLHNWLLQICALMFAVWTNK